MNEHEELNVALANQPMPTKRARKRRLERMDHYLDDVTPSAEDAPTLGNYQQWTTSDNKVFLPASRTCDLLPPGAYEIDANPSVGIFFSRINVKLEDLIRFPDSNSDRVIEEIRQFWAKKDLFRDYGIFYKRGICLWGPPGSGKTSTVQFVMKDVIDLGGVVFKFGHPELFVKGLRIFRGIQPDTPIVTILEDIDGILECYNESEVLQVLDGIDSVENIVFLATTNYPERLGARIINRPSRFDKRFKIGHPNEQCRRLYLERIVDPSFVSEGRVDIDRWVSDTDRFSLAHLKELYTSVAILGDDYKESIDALTSMNEQEISSSNYEETKFGFVPR